MHASYINGKLLKKLRTESNLTQEEVAKICGLSQAHIAKIENENVDPRLSTINKILNAISQQKESLDKIMTKKIISVDPKEKIKKSAKLMKKYDISQLPVIENGRVVGSILETSIVKNLESEIGNKKVEEIMEQPFPTLGKNENIETVKILLEHNPAVIIKERDQLKGIITKSDLLKICF